METAVKVSRQFYSKELTTTISIQLTTTLSMPLITEQKQTVAGTETVKMETAMKVSEHFYEKPTTTRTYRTGSGKLEIHSTSKNTVTMPRRTPTTTEFSFQTTLPLFSTNGNILETAMNISRRFVSRTGSTTNYINEISGKLSLKQISTVSKEKQISNIL